MVKKPRVLGIIGATASGKTALSLSVASRLNCEIICIDSMQVYRRMDIGTAKPTASERAAVSHHMLDIVEPGSSFSVAEYVPMAHQTIHSILSRGHIPLLVGGTGLYLQGLSQPMDYGGLPSDPAVRLALQLELDERGKEALHAQLHRIDPQTAARLHPNDTRRIIRALEIYHLTGRTMTEHRAEQASASPYDFCLFAIDWPREELHKRINLRVEQMMADGLLDEVRRLRVEGVPADAQSMQGLGYKELLPVLSRGASLPFAVEQIKTGTRNYARRQLIWFRRDRRIHWIDSNHMDSAAETIIQTWKEPSLWTSAD